MKPSKSIECTAAEHSKLDSVLVSGGCNTAAAWVAEGPDLFVFVPEGVTGDQSIYAVYALAQALLQS